LFFAEFLSFFEISSKKIPKNSFLLIKNAYNDLIKYFTSFKE